MTARIRLTAITKKHAKRLIRKPSYPLMDWLRDDLNNWLTLMFGERLYFDYDRDDMRHSRRAVLVGPAISAVNSVYLPERSQKQDTRQRGWTLRVPASMIPLSRL